MRTAEYKKRGDGEFMSNYSYSQEINQNKVRFDNLDINDISKMFTSSFESYDLRIKDEILDSFCQDFHGLAKEMNGFSERIWRMVITDMFFSYDEKGYLESPTTDNTIKRKQFAILAKAIISKLREDL